MSGRSSERLIEEVLHTDPGRFFWYLLTPIEEYEALRSGAESIDAAKQGYTAQLPPSTSLFNVYFPKLHCHVQFEKHGVIGGGERDWHVKSCGDRRQSAVMSCRLTGAELRISWFPQEVSEAVLDSFDVDAIRLRLLRVYDGAGDLDDECFADRFVIFKRIVQDLITLAPDRRRKIIANGHTRAGLLLDFDVVLPFLGFRKNVEDGTWDPPHTNGFEYLSYLRRVLLEVELLQESHAVLPGLAEFLNCDLFFSIPSAVPLRAEYACLGSMEHFSDSRLWDRYILATEQDKSGTPWYLDALSNIAQSRNSEFLEMKVLSLVSLGASTLTSIRSQLQSFYLEPSVVAELSDEELAEIVLTQGRFGGYAGGEQLLKNAELLRKHEDVGPLASPSRSLRSSRSQSPIRSPLMPSSPLRQSASISSLKTQKDHHHLLQQQQQQHTALPPGSLRTLILLSESNAQQVSGMLGEDPAEGFAEVWEDDLSTHVEKLEALFVLRALAFEGEGDPRLISIYESVLPNQPHLPLLSAFAALGVQPGTEAQTTDNAIMAMFFGLTQEQSPETILRLRAAVRAIAKERRSTELWHFLGYTDDDRCGSLTSSDSSNSSHEEYGRQRLPPGLWNIGNTCYLNSLLQFYYSVPEVREYAEHAAEEPIDLGEGDVTAHEEENKEEEMESLIVLDDEPVSKPSAENENSTTIGGRKVSRNEIVRSAYFVQLLGKLFNQMRTARNNYVIPSDILAYMALIRPQEDADMFVESGPSYLRDQLGAALQRQQDVTESIENVLDQLEATMPSEGREEDGEQKDLIKRLFYGTTEQVLQRVVDGANRRTKMERFSSLLIDPGEVPGTLYSALDRAFAEDVLELEEGPTKRTLQVTALPQFLQIQVQRVQFDRESYMPYKNSTPVIFKDVIYMDRYFACEENSDLAKKRKEANKLGAELLKLKQSSPEVRARLLERRRAVEATLDWILGRQHSETSSVYSSSDQFSLNGQNDSTSSSSSDDSDSSSDSGLSALSDKHTYSDYSRSSSSLANRTQNVQSPLHTPPLSPTNSGNPKDTEPTEPTKPAEFNTNKLGLPPKPQISETTIECLQGCSAALAEELERHDAHIGELEHQIDELFSEYKQHPYRLHALFIHKGDVSYGHYWVYIWNEERQGFLKYNDEYVTEAERSEVFDFSNNNATPYLLVYERDLQN